MSWSSAALLSALSVIDVRSEATCPAPLEVSAELARVLAVPENARIEERVVVRRDGNSLTIQLESPTGDPLAERSLPVEGSCEALARAVAVVVAAWLSDAHPEFVRPLPDTSPSTPAIEAREPPPAQPAPPLISPRSEAGASFKDTAVRPPRLMEQGVKRRVALAAGLGASVSSPSLAATALFSASWMPMRGGIGATSWLALVAAREQPLGSGAVQWSRWPLAFGPAWRAPVSATAFDLGLGVFAAWLRVEGRTFGEQNYMRDDVSFGSFAGVRFAANRGTLRPFASATGLLWLRRATAESSGPPAEIELPRLELLLIAGLEVAP